MNDEQLKLAFDLVTQVVTDQGGDGWGFILCQNPKELADKFQDDWFNERNDYEDSVSFGRKNCQEFVTFLPLDSDTSFADIVLILPWV